MKECKYCRTQYADNLVACPNCGGTKIVTAQELAEEAEYIQRETEYKRKANEQPKVHKMKLIGILAAIVVVVIAIVAVISINSKKPLSNGMTKDESKELLSQGITYLDNGEYEAAMNCFSQLSPDSKQYAEAQDLLLKSQNAYKDEIIKRANTHIDSKEFETAIDLISKAQSLLPSDSELSNVYDKAYSGYIDEVIKQVNSYVSSDKYELAIEYLESVKAKYPNDASLQDSYSSTVTAYHKVVRTEACEQANAYMNSKDYINAIKVVKTALDKIGSDDELTAKLTVYTNEYVPIVIGNASKQYKQYNAPSIYAAEGIISDALGVLPGNQELTAELNKYKELEPVRIIVMQSAEEGNGGTFATKDSASDPEGNKYTDVIYVDKFAFNAHDNDHTWWWYCYKTINLDYKYSKITGVLFQNAEYASASTKTQVIIEGFTSGIDLFSGNKLWTGKVSGDSKAQRINVDVSGMQYVAIEFNGDNGAGKEDEPYHYAYIAELYLWK